MEEAGKVALVTGAGSGIGEAVAIALAKEDFRVVLTSRRYGQITRVSDMIGARAHPIPSDIREEGSVKSLFCGIKRRYGRLDLLFNNAGILGSGANIEDTLLEEWNSVLTTNITGMFLCIREAFRLMRDQDPQGGRIINNGSISSTKPRPNSAPYTASKHAVSGLTRAASLDGRKYGIACGQIDIGNAGTTMAYAMASGVLQADLTAMAEPTFDVRHVAEAVVYMSKLPLEANVQSMTILATTMPYVGRG